MNFLLGHARVDSDKSRRDLLQALDHMQGHLRHYDCKLETMDLKLAQIEKHLSIPPRTPICLATPANPIPVDGSDFDPIPRVFDRLG